MNESNQIRVLCEDCGCYYQWDIIVEPGKYNNNVIPQSAKTCCPECKSQEVAQHAHHSAGTFNAEIVFNNTMPRYMSGPGSAMEPIKVDKKGG